MMMTKAEARDKARGHVHRVLTTALEGGWPDQEEWGYTTQEYLLIMREIEAIVTRLAK